MGLAENFEDLDVYNLANNLANRIHELSLDFPEYETYSLSDQIRRSARSIGAHIAEAWAHREYENSFKSKLTNSTGELNETLHWLQIALEADYLDPGECESLVNEYQKLRRMLNSMINRSDEFCSTN